MKTRIHLILAAIILSTFNLQLSTCFAQGTAFTYQGRLNSGGNPANGSYDLAFTLFATNTSGVAIAGPVTNSAVGVTNGLFTTAVDFGNVFNGSSNWLEMAVSTNGANSFTTLTPRQQLTPTPYAIMAENVSGTISSANLTSVGNNHGGSGNFFVGPSGNATTSGPDNTANGVNALAKNTSGFFNTANGAAALNSNTNGSYNTANGFQALYSNTSGSGNTANGVEALYSNTSGYDNTAIGLDALLFNTNGYYNTANGVEALYSNTSGSENTANGLNALNSNTSGYDNTAIGFEALENSTGGSNNIALGYNAGSAFTNNESSNIDIGNNGVTGESGVIRLGTPGVQTSTFIAGVINGNGGGLTNLAVSANQVTSVGNNHGGSGNFFIGPSGNAMNSGSFNTAIGDNALNSNTIGLANTANGFEALSNNTSGSVNTAIGAAALYSNTSGSDNTANGVDALFSNTNGSDNTANGFNALENSTGGSNNIALGYNAGSAFTNNESSNIDIGNNGVTGESGVIRLGTPGVQTNTFIAGVINGNGGGLTNLAVSANQVTSVGNNHGGFGNFFTGSSGNATTSGSDNTANGFEALRNNTSGSDNTANGVEALYSNTSGYENTANGADALFLNTSGDYNTANGVQALVNNTSGDYNTANGVNALLSNTSGSENTANGVQALEDSAGGSNNIALGYNAGSAFDGNESYNIDIGNYGVEGESGVIRLGTPGVQTRTLLTGNVGIGTNAPSQPLDVVGSGLFEWKNNLGTVYLGDSNHGIKATSGSGVTLFTYGVASGIFLQQVTGYVGIGNASPGHLLVVGTGGAYCDGTTWVNGSDRNSKKDFTAINPGEVLQKVAAMPITEWQYKIQPGQEHIGPMAQDFHAAFSLNGTDDKHISTVDEGGVALAAIQGLNEKLNEKDAEIQKLERQNDSLAKRLNELALAVKSLANK